MVYMRLKKDLSGVPFVRWMILAGVLLFVGSAITACSPNTRYDILSAVLDGVPAPHAPPKERRRKVSVTKVTVDKPTLPSPAALDESVPRKETLKHPTFQTYTDLSNNLPHDYMENIDWLKAAQKQLITPLANVDSDVVPPPVFSLDITLDPGIPDFTVVFPHEAHTYWVSCGSCHPAIFQMKAGANEMNMGKMFQGEYCGRCHGKVAFPLEACGRCHLNLAMSK